MMYWKAAAVFWRNGCAILGAALFCLCVHVFISWHFISIAEEHEMLFCSFDLASRITSREAEA